nr:MAG TPA: Mga helix-turn-helix domain [Caudoviricetes sp.]
MVTYRSVNSSSELNCGENTVWRRLSKINKNRLELI